MPPRPKGVHPMAFITSLTSKGTKVSPIIHILIRTRLV